MTQDFSNSELLAGLVLGDLSCAEEAQIAEVSTDLALHDDLDHAAGALAASLALSEGGADMPQGLADRLNAMGRAWAESTSTGNAAEVKGVPAAEQTTSSFKFPVINMTGWIAAAAAILVAWTVLFGQSLELSPEQQFEKLVATPGVQRTDWIATGHPSGPEALGEVIWDPETNTGVMVFSGLSINDPKDSVYQLWIFDATRPGNVLSQFDDGSELAPILTQRPIDGGVFSVGSEGRVVVPINAKLDIKQAVAFAVTIEQPGGVVVSDRQDVPVLAILN
ncbi:MAG: anti-sigma factor [Planctomycetota bacterium]